MKTYELRFIDGRSVTIEGPDFFTALRRAGVNQLSLVGLTNNPLEGHAEEFRRLLSEIDMNIEKLQKRYPGGKIIY